MGGISQYISNLKTVEEDSSYNSLDDSTFTFDVSKLTMDDEYKMKMKCQIMKIIQFFQNNLTVKYQPKVKSSLSSSYQTLWSN